MANSVAVTLMGAARRSERPGSRRSTSCRRCWPAARSAQGSDSRSTISSRGPYRSGTKSSGCRGVTDARKVEDVSNGQRQAVDGPAHRAGRRGRQRAGRRNRPAKEQAERGQREGQYGGPLACARAPRSSNNPTGRDKRRTGPIESSRSRRWPRIQYIYVMKGLNKTFPGGKQVLKDIWLSFFPGAKIGVLGLNGAGKSTLLKIMAGRDDRVHRRGLAGRRRQDRLPAAGAAARREARTCRATSRKAPARWRDC